MRKIAFDQTYVWVSFYYVTGLYLDDEPETCLASDWLEHSGRLLLRML